MDPLIEQFVAAIRDAYPMSHAKKIREERHDLAKLIKTWDDEAKEFEQRHGVGYPKIARELFVVCADTFVFFEAPTYRHLTLPPSATSALETMREFADDPAYYDTKIPIFDADGNCDLLDMSRYDADADDCPVLFDDHEIPDEHPVICQSFRRYLELVTLEIRSGDTQNEGTVSNYVARMEQRGTSEIRTLAEA